ncbi:MAG: hypothetical protein IK115_10955, partial [Lachnospiraceae bacterium]|nr:hypothetical protein [Lachnospiraceae bacterium]
MKRRERQLLTWIMTIVMLVGTVLPADLSFAGDAGETADAAQPALNRKSEYAVFNSINELNGVKSDESYYNTGISGGNRGLNYTEDKAEATPVSLASTTSLSGNSLNLDPTTVDAADKRWSYIINGSNELVEIYEYYTDQPTGYPAPVGIISGLNPSQVSSVANLNVNHMLCGNFDYYLPDEYTSYMYDNYEKYDYTVVGDPNEEKPVIMTDHGVAYVSGDPSIVKGQMSLSKLGELFAEAGTIIDLYREQKQKYLSD